MNFSQSILAAAVATLSLTATQHALAFDPAADLTASFSSTPTNPNGVWSYGYNDIGNLGYSFKPFNDASPPNPTIQGWHDLAYSNLSSTPAVGNYFGPNLPSWAVPGQMFLHPGPEVREDEAILRFTAPVAGLYNVSLTLLAGDSGETEGWVRLNGNILTTLGITSLNPSYSNGALSLAAGDKLDVVVGNHGNYLFDSTPIQMSISAVPEPETYALMGIGLALLGWKLRRRSGVEGS